MNDILMAVLAGLTYGFSMYVKKGLNGQKFDPWKLAATLVVSVLTALLMRQSGLPLDEMTFEQQFLIYAGAIPLVENLIKVVIRGLAELASRRPPKQMSYVGMTL